MDLENCDLTIFIHSWRKADKLFQTIFADMDINQKYFLKSTWK